MRDIPVFSTEAGVASLILSEIPYKAQAYIRVQDSCDPDKLLKECCNFCRAVGAERVYVTGHAVIEEYPFYTAVYQMSRLREGLPETDAALFPVLQNTLEQWRNLYNERMKPVPNSATMNLENAQKMLDRGDGYFIHRGEMLLGIGIAAGEKIDALVSAVPGAGQDVLLALNHALSGERVTVEVASKNIHAVSLYERLGFIQTAELSRWHQIF